MDFNPKYPFLIERKDPTSSVDIANYVGGLTDNQAMRQLHNTAIEEGMTAYWILQLQLLRDETIDPQDVVEESIELLKTNESDEKAYRNLVESTLSLIILFNRRRIGDVQYVYLESYYKNFSTNNAEECLKALSPTEKALTKYYKRIVTGGKGSRPVVILLPKNLQRYVEFMIKIRKTGMVPSENPYLFALPKAADRWIPAQKVRSKFSKNADLENPSTITSNKLRKQIASIMQILNKNTSAHM
ncbi:hypothetical protein V9T40_014930 [Parthenolecanium corni]|uniref:Uncharacterized protein n=1 Tax=Parthenolecanium corni TaxID=536013 RepID=A0AAN9TLV3_9HEMI